MSGRKRNWRDWPDRGLSPPPLRPKAPRYSPEPGPSRNQDLCSSGDGLLDDLGRLGSHRPEQLWEFLKAHTPDLEHTLSSPQLSFRGIHALLCALRCTMEESPDPQEVQPVLQALLQPPFMQHSLLGFVAHLGTFCGEGGQISEVVGDTVATLHHLLTAFPNQAHELVCYPLDLLSATIRRLQSRGFQFTWIVQKQLWDTKILLDKAFPNRGEPSGGSLASPAGREDFRLIPVFPTPEDIFLESPRKLKHNKVSGRYRSDAEYLDTQFRLLREDLIKPLRDGISAQFTLRNHFLGSEKAREGLLLYQNVCLVEVDTSFSGTMYLARYSPKKRATPLSSKRLQGGSLVCLISGDSDHVLFGTVVGSHRREVLRGAVWLEFRSSHSTLQRHLARTRFTMVESPAFFEAYRHVLQGLQEVGDDDRVPFRRYIVKCARDVSPPAYLEGLTATFDLSVLRSPGSKEDSPAASASTEEEIPVGDLTAMSPLCTHLWTPETFPGLDESQILAIRMALSREFVLIQGPPGTGKTFIGLKILQVLLANQAFWNQDQSPCLVVCYTNHALDQFLEGILQFQKWGVVRVGGRSKSERMAQCSLRNLRKQLLCGPLLAEEKRLYSWRLNCLRSQKESIKYCTEVLQLLDRGILRAEELKEEISDDKLRTPRGGLLQWLNIHPQRKRGEPQRPRPHRRAADLNTDFVQWENNERFLDDDDDDYGDENTEAWGTPESKFAHIIPAEESDSWMVACLREGDIMSSQEVARIQDPEDLRLRDRWRLYRRWVASYKQQLKEAQTEKLEAYEKDAASLQELTFGEDLNILRRSKIIGMTTTGAAKHRKLLQKIGPRIVVVEEAAEILEAHVLTALTASCQHLILIGDHQQLRPKPADYTLEKKYFLGISLFERMINNNLPYVQLLYQHRMRPEISQLLTPLFYKELRDHAGVLEYEKIKGMDRSIFFIQHCEAESHSVDSESYSNQHEASFLVSLASYLLKQGYAESQITILSPYHGQVVKIRSFLKEEGLEGVAAHAVDDFQGEENDIVLLSLVRSNSQGKVGFLKDKNRLCVALSRAKRGFYCIGNLNCLSAGGGLWKELTLLLKSKDLLGEELAVLCQNHPDTKTAVKCRADFSKLPDGGCSLECQTRLECGHPCKRRCHPLDKEHRTNACRFPCGRTQCEFNHQCPRKCSEVCRPCSVEVERVMPKCGHSQMVPCHIPTEAWVCQEPCQELRECGHPCKLLCGQNCRSQNCRGKVQVTLPCSHTTQTDCFRQKMTLRCSEKCKQTLECGHRCQGSCSECVQGRMHVACQKKCTRILLCSHVCRGSCCENCPPCQRRCRRKCSHSRCDKPCGEVCFPCTQPCAWTCRHFRCTELCSDICDRPGCNEPCRKTLKCKHPCVGLCGEPCPPKCRVCHRDELTEIFFGNEDEPDARFVVLADCGHVFEVEGLDRWMGGAPEAGAAEHVQQKVCPKCSTPIQSNPRYNGLLKAQQQHLDEIKEKIQGGKMKLWAGKTDLLSRVATLPLAIHMDLRRKVEEAPSVQSLRSWQNTVSFLQSLQRLKVQAEKCSQERREALSRCTEAVEAWLCGRREGDAFTAQQLREGRNEIKRISYLANVFVRLTSCEQRLPPLPAEALAVVDEALQLLNRQQPFTEAEEEPLLLALARIDTLLPASGMQLSEAERVSVTAAMRFGRGHWYKCPKGHFYTVGECGRPMQESQCPECRAVIGGRKHRLHGGSTAADDQMLNPVEEGRGGGGRLGNIVELVAPLALPDGALTTASHRLGSPPRTSGSSRDTTYRWQPPSDWLMPPHSPSASPASPKYTPASPSCTQHTPVSPDASPCPDSPSLPVSSCPGPASPADHPPEEGS